MADKGKGKAAVLPPDPITISDDSDDDFFVVKKKPVFRDATPPRSPSPPRRAHSSSEESDDPSSGLAKKRRKKPVRAKKNEGPSLPEWTRHTSNEGKKGSARGRKGSSTGLGRGSTEDRDRADTIVIGDSDEGESSTNVTRGRITLTPPPELSEDQLAHIKKQVATHFDHPELDDNRTNEDETIQSSPEKQYEGGKCTITVRMQAPPERKASATPAAIKEYEKPRKLTVFVNGPMSIGIAVLADRIQRRAEEVILTYDGDRVYPRSTPAQLNIFEKAEMSGYEKPYWDQLQKERRAILTADSDEDSQPVIVDPAVAFEKSVSSSSALNGTAAQAQTEASGSALSRLDSDVPLLDPPESQSQTQSQSQETVKFRLRSATNSEQRLGAPLNMKVNTVLRFYCRKIGKPKEDADGLRLVFDGETLDGEMTIGELDIEDGDMMDVVPR
ncbi:hypothetical protein IAT40_006391 [Kwoniella sp. CBS 6097]